MFGITRIACANMCRSVSQMDAWHDEPYVRLLEERPAYHDGGVQTLAKLAMGPMFLLRCVVQESVAMPAVSVETQTPIDIASDAVPMSLRQRPSPQGNAA